MEKLKGRNSTPKLSGIPNHLAADSDGCGGRGAMAAHKMSSVGWWQGLRCRPPGVTPAGGPPGGTSLRGPPAPRCLGGPDPTLASGQRKHQLCVIT